MMRVFAYLTFLLSLVVAFYTSSQPLQAAQAAAAPQDSRKYQITVWVVRPGLKRNPTPSELTHHPEQWTVVQGFASESKPFKDDDALLAYLRNANPLFTFSRFEHRVTTMVAGDEKWNVPLTATRLTLRVAREDRAKLLRTATAALSAERQERYLQFAAKRLIVKEDALVILEDGHGKGQSTFTGIRAISDGSTFTVNPDMQYATSYDKLGSHPAAVRHTPTDVLLVRVQQLR